MFTERELEVLARRAQGEPQRVIAKALNITQAAVSQFEKSAHTKILDAQKVLDFLPEMRIKVRKTRAGDKIKYTGELK